MAPPPPSPKSKQLGGGGGGDGWGSQAANGGASGAHGGGGTSSSTGAPSTQAGQENGAEETEPPGEYDGTTLGLSPRRTQYNFKVEKAQLKKIDETGAESTQGKQQPHYLGEAAADPSQRGENAGAKGRGRGASADGAGDTAMDSSATSRGKTKNGKKGLSLDDLLARNRNRPAAAKKKDKVKKRSFAGKKVDDGEHGEHGEPEDPTAVSWEQQLRTMAGVGPGPDVSGRKASSSSCTERSAERGDGAGQKDHADKKVRLFVNDTGRNALRPYIR